MSLKASAGPESQNSPIHGTRCKDPVEFEMAVIHLKRRRRGTFFVRFFNFSNLIMCKVPHHLLRQKFY